MPPSLPERAQRIRADRGRLAARPNRRVDETSGEIPQAGLQPLGLDGERDGLLYVPASYRAGRPAPIVLMFHGAGGNAHHGIGPFLSLADGAGLLLVAPDSRAATWDVITGRFGSDVRFVDQALAHVFDRFDVDPARVAVEGFSDGASYALSLAMTNGDLFTHAIAFSPGFASPGDQVGAPLFFISHGTRDDVLPIDRCSRRIVPQLRRQGYDVTYREFDQGDAMSPEIVSEAVSWLFGGAP